MIFLHACEALLKVLMYMLWRMLPDLRVHGDETSVYKVSGKLEGA